MSVDFSIPGAPGCAINVSNGRAREILNLLGYDPSDLCGEVDAADLRARAGRALLWLQTAAGQALDAGTEDSVDGRVTECGRRAGYFSMRLNQLCELADRAAGRTVIYG